MTRGYPTSRAALVLGLFATGCPQLLDDSFGGSEPDAVVSTAAGSSGGSAATEGTGLVGTLPESGSTTSAGGAESSAQGGAESELAPEAGAASGSAAASGSGGESSGGANGGSFATDAGTDDPPSPMVDAASMPCLAEPELCDGLDNDCNLEIDEDGACPARCFGFVPQGVPHMFCDDAVTRSDTEALCVAQDMRRVWIQSADENDAIVDFVASTLQTLGDVDQPAPDGSYSVWTGASDIDSEGDWRWGNTGPSFWQGARNGEPVDDSFSQWSPGYPDGATAGDCGVLYIWADSNGNDPGDWNAVDCNERHGFVCERP